MDSQKVLSTQTLPSSITYEELTSFHLCLPLDPKIDQLLSLPKDLMSYLYKAEVEASIEQIDLDDAVSKNDDYKKFLSFVLFRLNYAYFQSESHKSSIEYFISTTFPRIFTQMFRTDPTGLSARLAFVLNVSQGLLESKISLVNEALETMGGCPYQIYSPLNKQSAPVAVHIEKVLREITHTSLFEKAVKEFLSFFKDAIEMTDTIICACQKIQITPIGFRGVTRVLGMILPNGIALNLKYLSFMESKNSFISRALVVSVHNIGQYIASLLPSKALTSAVPKLGKELLDHNNIGYLFQSILFGDIKAWRDPICMEKLLTVRDWPVSPPLFEDCEQLLVKKQTIRSTFNSSMFLSAPIEALFE